ncbi:MAG: hypothetical protein ACR2OM_15440 [Aestuariivirgaceae bacterium]
MTRNERTVRGRQAKWLLDQELFHQAIDACLVHCQMEWAASETDDSTSREVIYHRFQAVGSIEEMLKNFVEDGTRAEREKDEHETK